MAYNDPDVDGKYDTSLEDIQESDEIKYKW